MYEKFGELDSAEEINRCAAAQKQEGDVQALISLAKENGLDEEDAKDYAEGLMDELCNPLTAALGKLEIECAEYKIKGVLLDWVNELKQMAMESEEFAIAIRRKGKGLDGYIAKTADRGYKERCIVDSRIVNKTTIKGVIGNHEFFIGIPDGKTRRELAEEYYLGKEGAK